MLHDCGMMPTNMQKKKKVSSIDIVVRKIIDRVTSQRITGGCFYNLWLQNTLKGVRNLGRRTNTKKQMVR